MSNLDAQRPVACAEYPDANLRLLSLTRDGLPTEVPPGVRAEAAWQWMLGAGIKCRPST